MTGRTKGILSLTASAFGFALMAACVRLCDDFGGPVSSFQKSFFRNFLAFLIASEVWFRRSRAAGSLSWPRLSPRAWVMLTTRSVVGTCGIFANFYALSRITIAEGQTLNKTAPFFTVFFVWFFLKERPSLRQTLALLVAFAGVLLIAKPGFAGAATVPLAVGLLGGACAGGAYACVRALAILRTPPSFIVWFFSAFSMLASLPFMLAGFDPMTWRQTVILLGAGAGAAIGQFGVTAAYRFAPPREIAVFDYSNILFTAAFGYLLFAQVPDVASILGFVVILAAALLMRGR